MSTDKQKMKQAFKTQIDFYTKEREVHAKATADKRHDSKDPFYSMKIVNLIIKFYTLALRMAPKDFKKMEKIHREIGFLDNEDLCTLMELDPVFDQQEKHFMAIDMDKDNHATILKPGEDGLGGIILSKSKGMKREYDERQFILDNWMKHISRL